MALKIISFIFIISLAFGIPTSTQIKDVTFDVNKVINQVTEHRSFNLSSDPFLPESTGEFMIDTGVVYVVDKNNQSHPAIAFDGTNYLIVWIDVRVGSGNDIFGARVTPEGTVLDPAGIQISVEAHDQLDPSVAFDGTNFLVVWQDTRSGSWDIYGARVNQLGIVLDTNGVAIATHQYNERYPSVAFDGTNYFVVWEDWRNGSESDIYGARVSQNGTVLDPNGIAISTASDDQENPSITFGGTNYMAVWIDYRSGIDVYGARVSQNGTVLDPNGLRISTSEIFWYRPSIAFDGTNYLVAWSDGRNHHNYIIYGTRVSQFGNVLDTNGIAISTSTLDQGPSSIAFDGTNYLVVWQDARNNGDIYGARVNQAGQVLDSTGIPISSKIFTQQDPSIAFGSSNYLVVWHDLRYGNQWDIYNTRITTTGIVLDTINTLISTSANSQWYPSVAFDDTNFLVVWQDNRNNRGDIYGARVNQSGMILDSTAIPISNTNNDEINPSVAFDGNNYLVVWADSRSATQYDIYGSFVDRNGTVLNPSGIPILTVQGSKGHPSVTFGDPYYFVVWNKGTQEIYCARVNQSGVVLDPNGIRIGGSDEAYNPSVAFDGTNYLVAWDAAWVGIPNWTYKVVGTLVSQQGIVLSSFSISTSINISVGNTSIAFDGTNYYVVWEKGGGYSGIYGARVRPNGMVMDPNGILISDAVNYQTSPSVVFEDTNYFVIWSDNRNIDYDLYGAKIYRWGRVGNSFPVSTRKGNQSNSKIIKGSNDQLFITYSGWIDSINHHPANTMRIWYGFYPFIVGIAEENSKVKIQSEKLLEVYPNPAKGVIRVRYPWSAKEQTHIKIFDVAGKVVKEIKIIRSTQNDKDGEIKISLKGINPGIYFLEVGKETKKFLVVK